MSSNSNLTVKQQRDARRAEKVAALKKKQAAEKRNARIGWLIGGSLGAIAIAAIVTLIVVTATPKPDPSTIKIEGLKTFDLPQGVHVDLTAEGTINPAPPAVDYEAEYGMNPPAGGNHWTAWINCGVYTEQIPNERGVHALEHGAVWVTYDPTKVDQAGVDEIIAKLPKTYSLVTPYEGLPTPVVASAWGAQVQLDGADDERLDLFVDKYWRSAAAPEPNAICTNGIDGPGKVA